MSTVEIILELLVILVGIMYLAYLGALLDIHLARKRASQQAIKDAMWHKLKQRNDY